MLRSKFATTVINATYDWVAAGRFKKVSFHQKKSSAKNMALVACRGRESDDLRHPCRSAESCCLPTLTRFTVTSRAGSDSLPRRLAPRQTNILLPYGGVRERPNRHDWKSCVGQPTVGSNPTSSATPAPATSSTRCGGAACLQTRTGDADTGAIATYGTCSVRSRLRRGCHAGGHR